MIKVKMYQAAIPGGSTGTEIATLTPPEGRRYDVKEVQALTAAGAAVQLYVEDEQLCEFNNDVNAVDPRRIVTNWEVPGGAAIRMTGTNNAGGAASCGVVLVYDDVTA